MGHGHPQKNILLICSYFQGYLWCLMSFSPRQPAPHSVCSAAFFCFECLIRPSASISFVLSVQSPVGNNPKDPALRAKLVNILNHVLTRAKGNAVRDSVKGLSCGTCARQFVACMLDSTGVRI